MPKSSALDTTRTNTSWLDIFICWGAGIFAAMQFAKYSISYDSLILFYQKEGSEIGALLSVVGLVGIFFGSVAGVLSGNLGYKRVLVTSLSIGGALSIIQSFLPNYPVLFISRIIEGISHLGIIVAAPTLMLRSSARRHHSLVMGIWGTFFGVAFAISGWLGSYILNAYGLSVLYLSHGVISLPILSYFLFIYKSDQSYEPVTVSININCLLRDTIDVYLNPRTCLPGIVFLFHTCMFVSLLTFIPRMSQDNSIQAILFITLPLFSIAGTFLSGFLSQYCMRPSYLVFTAYCGVALATFMTVLFADTSSYFVSSAALLLFLSGIVQGGAFTLIPALSKNAKEQAMGNGSIAQLGNLGATIGSPIFALVIDKTGNYGAFYVVFILCLMGCCASLMTKRVTTP